MVFLGAGAVGRGEALMSHRKGSRTERELVQLLDEAGFAVMRAPASGSATDRNLPDVLAGNGQRFYAIEAKSSGGEAIYLDGEEVEALIYFARNFGANARVGVRFDNMDWFFFHPGDLHRTDGGNYRVTREAALAKGVGFEKFVEDADGRDGPSGGVSVREVLEAVETGVMTAEDAADILEPTAGGTGP